MHISARLMKGAQIIGRFWAEGQRCSAAWAPVCPDADADKTHFCKAKMRWVEVAREAGRELVETEPILTCGMNSPEFDATGITITIFHSDHGDVRIGPKGEIMMRDMARLVNAPDGLDGFLKILKVFPKAKVVRSEAAVEK